MNEINDEHPIRRCPVCIIDETMTDDLDFHIVWNHSPEDVVRYGQPARPITQPVDSTAAATWDRKVDDWTAELMADSVYIDSFHTPAGIAPDGLGAPVDEPLYGTTADSVRNGLRRLHVLSDITRALHKVERVRQYADEVDGLRNDNPEEN